MVSDIERLLAKVDVGDCWEWAGARSEGGYGIAWLHGKAWKAHRAVYTLLVGKIPGHLQLDHLCRNRPCVNPDHLEPVSQRANVLRGVGPSAVASRATRCPQGHRYEGDNLYTHPVTGDRVCRACRRNRERQRRLHKALQGGNN